MGVEFNAKLRLDPFMISSADGRRRFVSCAKRVTSETPGEDRWLGTPRLLLLLSH